MKMSLEKIKSAVLGHAVGDSLGVPVEFEPRYALAENPVMGMREYGTFNLPKGCWSDDTSASLALLDSLARQGRPDYRSIMENLCRWLYAGEFTPTGTTFDVGRTTQRSILRYRKGVDPLLCGGSEEHDNGNGSLMRIIPIILYLAQMAEKRGAESLAAALAADEPLAEIHRISDLTHRHPRSEMACGIYAIIAGALLDDSDVITAVKRGSEMARNAYTARPEFASEMAAYQRVFDIPALAASSEKEISSTGYVVSTLEAALWCLLNTGNYHDCVLKAVNLGDDTDTVAAVAGGLAGLAYGLTGIPSDWLKALKRIDYLESLCLDFWQAVQ